MAKLSQAQIEAYARAAGLSPDRARIAAAIAMAESREGETTAHNATPPDDSYGLWQINMLGAMGPARRRALGITRNEELYDPAVNARAMAMISGKGSNFRPWSTYTSGAYEKYLKGNLGPVGPGGAEQALDLNDLRDWGLGMTPFSSGTEGLTSLAELGIGVAEWVGNPRSWVRTVQVVTGAVLVAVGLATMTRGTWQPAAAAVSKVAPVRRIKSVTKPKPAPKPAPKAAS